MRDAFLSWPGWKCTPWPADGADVLVLDGTPPEGFLSIPQEADFFHVLFCRTGGAVLEWAGGKRLFLTAGQMLFVPGQSGVCRLQFSQEHFQGVLVREMIRTARAALSCLWHSREGRESGRQHGCAVIEGALWCETLFLTLDHLPPEHRGNYCAIKVLELLYLFHAGGALKPGCSRIPYLDRQQVRTVQDIHNYILEHLEQRLTIQQLSRQFRISGTNLKACFRQLYGMPIHQYFLERRMARAAQLLCSTNQTVLQIAAAVGYSSVSQFGVAFKARYHVSPSQFRRDSKKIHYRLDLSESE